ESAGSFAVSALMASPLSKEFVHAAIGESGAFFGKTLGATRLAESQKRDAVFAEQMGMRSLKELRAVDAQRLLDAVLKNKEESRFSANIDGYFMPADAYEIYSKGRQAHIPLLAGWNRDEGNYHGFFGDQPVNKENYAAKMRTRFGESVVEAMKLFPGDSETEIKSSAGFLAGADFISYGTWKWIEAHLKTGVPVFRYEFDQAPPGGDGNDGDRVGVFAYHSAEIEFVFGMLDSKQGMTWRPEDYKVSEVMQTYWTNFAKTGNPNGAGVPEWPQYEKKGFQVMHLGAHPQAAADKHRAQFEFLDKTSTKAN
ncbi:MAG: carboxylesterase family protein, partial [Candidatus Acidiferrum sp.]